MNRLTLPMRLLLLSLCGCSAHALAADRASAPADALEPGVNTSAPAAPPATSAAPATTATAPPKASVGAAVAPAGAAARGAAASSARGAAVSTARGAAVSTARGGAHAMDRVELDNTQITGNRELPRVMYVVPWKKPDLGDFGGRPAKSLLDEMLQPLDREVFGRQVRYYDALQPDAAASGAPAPAGSTKNAGAAPTGTRDEK